MRCLPVVIVAFASCKTPPASPAPDPEGVMEAAMDPGVDPCQDFYQYACGGWIASTTLPAERPALFRSFHSIVDSNQTLLRTLVEDASEAPGDDPVRQRVGIWYGTCMDEAAVDARGIEPLVPMLAEIDAIADLSGVLRAAGRAQLGPGGALVAVEAFADLANPDVYTAHVGQAKLGLPDRDYYLEPDEAGRALLADYQAHLVRLLVAGGTPEAAAVDDASALVAFETKVAAIQWSKEQLREVDKQNNPMDRAALSGLAPGVPFDAFLEGMGRPDLSRVNVLTPSYFQALGPLLAETPLATLKVALRASLLKDAAPALSAALHQEVFAFHGTRVQGTMALQPRWKRCLQGAEAALSHDVGRMYVDAAFAGRSAEVAIDLIGRIERAFEKRVPALEWMDEATRTVAVDKARAVKNKIGHPRQWRSYDTVPLVAGDHFGNWLAGQAAEARRMLAQVGGPVDPDEWFMNPQAVNAYYNPSENEIVFPAGILQPPFFSADFPIAVNLGAIGMVMGHELTHGFDDEGRKFDKDGRLVEWWAPEVASRFEERAQCLVRTYDGFEVDPGVRVNGSLTLGENIADLGGYRLALASLASWEAEHGPSPSWAGLDGRQQLFVGAAQAWCAISTEGYRQMQVRTDPHAPARFRVEGPIRNLPEFQEAFSCPAGSPMAPADRCEVW
jgi:predicted metalloendopeptidase